jgi:hypothetical protein
VWVVPGKRTKNGVEHKIPVAAATRAILAGLPRFAGCDLVFSTNGKTSISGFSKYVTGVWPHFLKGIARIWAAHSRCSGLRSPTKRASA